MKKEVKYVLTQLESKIENFLSQLNGVDKKELIQELVKFINSKS